MKLVRSQVRAKIEGEVGDEETLIVCKWREDNGKPRCDYYLTWNKEPTDLHEYARVIKQAYRIEESFRRAKSECGCACVACCSPGSFSVVVDISGDGASTYFNTTSQTCDYAFTWTKPSDVTNADAKRDFTFTYYAVPNGGGSSTLLGSLKVHIAWAEVQVQFAGTGNFENKTSQGG